MQSMVRAATLSRYGRNWVAAMIAAYRGAWSRCPGPAHAGQAPDEGADHRGQGHGGQQPAGKQGGQYPGRNGGVGHVFNVFEQIDADN